MGRLDMGQKGLDILIQAFAFYRKQGGKAALRIAGDGPDKASLEKMCEILGLGESVCFVGKVIGDEKWNFFKTCNYFCIPPDGMCFRQDVWRQLPVAHHLSLVRKRTSELT